MNNASSSNDNAIAESQITNIYYESIRVEREIGNHLLEVIEKKPSVIILTGHAGDGKTSLLHQMLRKLDVIQPQTLLKISEYVKPSGWSNELFYVKDMSELTADEQVDFLDKAFKNKNAGGSSIVVSNTGPIIDTFKKLVERYYSTDANVAAKVDEAEMDILRLLDENQGEYGYINDQEVLIVNLAKFNNTDIIPELIEKVLNPQFWDQGSGCSLGGNCPIYNNYLTLVENKEYIKKFVKSYYQWLYENDKRLTIRQILSHLTYAITGNLQCSSMNILNPNRALFDYHFANLFFGYVGFKEQLDANKIRGIAEIKKLKMDEKNLQFDYDYFVREDFVNVKESVKPIVSYVWDKEMKRKVWKTEDLLEGEHPFNVRKSMRRFQILFSDLDVKSEEIMLGDLYSPIYPFFLKVSKEKLSPRELRSLKPKIMKALQIMIIGSEVKNSSKNPLYLPLKQAGINNQNVYLLVGKVENNEVSIEQEKVLGKFGEPDYYQLVIKFNRIETPYPLSLLLLDYFERVANGSLATKLSSSLSHGIDKMKAKMYSEYREDNGTIQLLVRTLNCIKIVNLEIDEDYKTLYFE